MVEQEKNRTQNASNMLQTIKKNRTKEKNSRAASQRPCVYHYLVFVNGTKTKKHTLWPRDRAFIRNSSLQPVCDALIARATAVVLLFALMKDIPVGESPWC